MSRRAVGRSLGFGAVLMLWAFTAMAQAPPSPLPQGLTCGIAYTNFIGIDCTIGLEGTCDILRPVVTAYGACNGVATAESPSSIFASTVGHAAAGYTYVFDGDVGNHGGEGFHHQELTADGGGTTSLDLIANPDLSRNFVLPKGAACGFHSTGNSPGGTCMGFNPGWGLGVESAPPPGTFAPGGMPVQPGCPPGWTARKAFDMSSGSWHWVWCEYDDPNHRSIGRPTISVSGVACGISHNAGAATAEDPGPTCMGYHPLDGSSYGPYCLGGLQPSPGWFDQGRPAGVGLGFCTMVTGTITEPAPARGVLDTTFTTSGTFSGYAYDPNAPESSIYVDLYIDGPPDSGAPGFRVVANGPRPDVNTALGITGAHGYSFTLPAQFLGAAHTVYPYGISLFGQANRFLAPSPGRYSPPAPPPPPPPLCRGCLTP